MTLKAVGSEVLNCRLAGHSALARAAIVEPDDTVFGDQGRKDRVPHGGAIAVPHH